MTRNLKNIKKLVNTRLMKNTTNCETVYKILHLHYIRKGFQFYILVQMSSPMTFSPHYKIDSIFDSPSHHQFWFASFNSYCKKLFNLYPPHLQFKYLRMPLVKCIGIFKRKVSPVAIYECTWLFSIYKTILIIKNFGLYMYSWKSYIHTFCLR